MLLARAARAARAAGEDINGHLKGDQVSMAKGDRPPLLLAHTTWPLSLLISLSLSIYIYIYTYTCIYVYMYVCVYIYIYIYTDMYMNNNAKRTHKQYN